MQISRTHFFIFFFLLSSFISNAQTAWTLQQCVDYAVMHNLQVKQSELNTELTHNSYQESVASMFPSLNGNASQNYFYGRSIDPTTNGFTNERIRSNSFSLSSTVPLFEGLQLQNTLRQSKLNYESSQFELKKIQNDISLNVVTLYLQVLYNQDLLASADKQVEATQAQFNRTHRMEELGSASKGSLLDIEAQLAQDDSRRITAKAQLDQSMLSLKQLLELDSVENFSIVQPDAPVPEFIAAQYNANSIYQEALKNQPDIRSQELKVKSAERGLSIARGGIYPRLYLSGALSTNYSSEALGLDYTIIQPAGYVYTGYTSTNDSVFTLFPSSVQPVYKKSSFSDQINHNLGKSIGLSLQVPIFNGWNVRTNVKRAKIGLEEARLTQEITRKNLYKSIQQSVSDAQSSFQKYGAAQKNSAAQEQAYNYNQQRFDLGLISTFDYLTSKNNVTKAQADLLQARYDYIFRLKIIDFYLGKPFTF